MSKAFAKKYGNGKYTKKNMRDWCKQPGRVDKEGKIIYFTEQAHKDVCDVNKIIAKYDKQGLITHVSKFEGKFGDLSGVDFKMMQDQVAGARSMFEALPVEIRNEFRNDPANLLSFMDDESNRKKAIELGLIRNDWTENTDGLGEHVNEGENIVKDSEDPPPIVE